ncbi:uncharacterized protein CCOS01_00350 [Colletotrichum costaricense]|uniref:Uncharacterized protein n=1 Tax=Colletotrichum costaricense TaxID=1209916 RepID=A0AAI9ZAI2_9PEZI|nr:uncharacterized protein CCOS01_00350 [Colletotrichum costaricense]KAK1539036.1 hypothetical protein CCOS01_00350 [Colletotrichum costaricense]
MSSLLLRIREEVDGGGGGSGGGGGMTLPLVLAIAIGGGVLLFICLAFFLIALAGRRHRARARARSTTPRTRLDLDSDGGSIRTPSPRPRRLTKPKPGEPYADMVEVQGKKQPPHRSLSSIISVPRSKSWSVFSSTPSEGAGGQQRGGHLRRNNSWIDEDAIHGPRVQSDGRRLSIRDSFILRTPTLPDLFGHKGEGDGHFDDECINYSIEQPRPVSMPAQRGQPLRMPLPRTASYELAEKLAAAARGGPPVLPTPQGPVPRPVPLQRLRHKTTESDLAEILRSTEERLQLGTPTNSRPATRQRAASASAGSSVKTPRGSPTKSQSPIKAQSPIKIPSPVKNQSPVRSRSPAKTQVLSHVGQALDLNAQRARTPSPSKRMVIPMLVQTPNHHNRNTSQSSAVSDADSLFGETTPEVEHILPTGLSSPSRRSEHESPTKPTDNGASIESPGSDASSSLSTLYSVNEPEDDSKTGGTGHADSTPRGRKPRSLVIDTQICDPFITPGPPEVPPRSPKRQSSSLPPLRRMTPPEEEILNRTPTKVTSVANSPIPRPLDVIKRSSTADQLQTRYSIMMQPSDLAASPETIRPKSVMSMKPVFLVSSNSVVSMRASPGTSPEDNGSRPAMPNNRLTFGPKAPVFPPPLALKAGLGSPNREALRMGSPGGKISPSRGSPSPSGRAGRQSTDSAASPVPGSPTRRPLPSPDLSKGGSPTPRRYKRGMASPIRDRALSRQPTPRESRVERVLSSSDCPSIVLKPSSSPKRNSYHRDFAVMGLQSTVAQLRRMNSQMSTFSAGSSISDPDSPTLPNLRGGGFSPDRSNSRVSKMGRQNYLSLGTSPGSAKRTKSIKSARNSIAVLKSRPGGNKHLDSLRAAVEEKENERRNGSLIRGPRPLNPTPRSAGRGLARDSVVTVESPTRRRISSVDTEDQKRLERPIKHQDSGTSLGAYGKEDYLLSSPDSLTAGAERQSPNMRV